MKSANQQALDQPASQPAPKTDREQRLDRVAEQVVEQARGDAKSYLRESKVPGGGE